MFSLVIMIILKVKLEIGSSVRPVHILKKSIEDIYSRIPGKTGNGKIFIAEYELKEVVINVLAIERTFLI